MQAKWTDLHPTDLFTIVSAGRSHFHVDDLLRLVTLISDLKKNHVEMCKANYDV